MFTYNAHREAKKKVVWCKDYLDGSIGTLHDIREMMEKNNADNDVDAFVAMGHYCPKLKPPCGALISEWN